MASFSEEDGILRLPAASPCRRDYQLRSSSPQTSDCESSRPQSPWLPRSQLQQLEEPMSPLRLYEPSAAFDRPTSRSGPLPSTSRSYSYCSPLPSPSPLPSYFGGAAGPGVLTSPRSYRQSSSFVGRLPSSGWESSEDRAVEEAAPPCLRNIRFSPSPTNLRRRNCVSGELGRNFEMLQALSEARKCKSGEIVGLDNVRADVIFPIPESRKAEVRKHRPPGFVLWESLNDADNVSSRRRLSSSAAIVPIPFKWEETSAGKASASQTTSASVQAQSSEKAMSQPGATKPVATSSDVGGASAVPFKWEVAPGKPKLEEKACITSVDAAAAAAAAAPALQLPPRLASAATLKRNSWALSPQPSRARSLSASVSDPVAKLQQQHSHRLSEELPSPRAAKSKGFSGALSQFGTPQYQSAEYNSLCEDSSNRARSPTSTLCGPGTPSSSSSSSSSRKPSVSFSQSAESFDPWSYGDHATSTCTTSRHSYTESHVEDSSVKRRHDEGDPMVDAIVKLRRKLKLKSAKPPKSPVQAPPSLNCNNGYSFQGEEFFDCQAHASSPSPSRAHNSAECPPSDVEDEVKPPTRLPYKMPPSPARDVAPPSPARPAPDFVNCLALPRFLSKGGTSPNHWVENPSWNIPSDAPARSTLEDGYRSPAYKATLDLFSPSPELMSKKSMKLRNSSLRRRHPHLVEVLCNTLKQSLLRCTKRNVSRTHSITLYDDQIAKRHQSFMW